MPINSSHPAPVIGISGSSPESASVKAMVAQIRQTGAIPLLLANHGQRDAAQDITKIDALIVMGNNADIDPALYGASKDTHTQSESDTAQGRARADYEFNMLKAAMEQKMPVLGVCGGMQRINVLCGGTLHQHVPDLVGHNEHAQQDYKIDGYVPVQPMLLDPDSTLGSVAAGITSVYTPGRMAPPLLLLENSMHHQAVDRIGMGLRTAATSDDVIHYTDGTRKALVEAIEADPHGKFGDQTVIGVQWHPEFGASPLGERLADFMAEKAQSYAKTTHREHDISEIVHENMVSSLPQNVPAPRAGSLTAMVLSRRMRTAQENSYGLAI